VVEGGKGDVDHVDVCVVQHVLHAAIGAHVGKIALNDVAALLHQVAHRRDGVELRQLAKCGQMVQQTGSAQACDAYAERSPQDLVFVCCLHSFFSDVMPLSTAMNKLVT